MSETHIKKKGKSTKTLTRSEFEDDSIEKRFYDEDGNHATKVIPEKDETEEKLEKLLFGDDAGFHDALKSHQTRGTWDLVLQDESDKSEGEDEEEDGLENVADADVSGLLFLTFLCEGVGCTDLFDCVAFLFGFGNCCYY